MKTPQHASPRTLNINKPCYIAFTLIGIVFLIRRDLPQASVFLGLGLVFDPFNLTQPFPQRPFYQQAWLIVHLAIAMALLALVIFVK